jgi:uncharacterized protein YeaO (DUF488 family)
MPEVSFMPVRIVRLGAPRLKNEGVRLGTVRRLPRGIRKTEYAARDYFDAWLPEIAPSAALLASARSRPWTSARWNAFERRYRREMRAPAAARLLNVLAALSKTADFSVGCYCEDAARCHRSILRELLKEAGARVEPQ